ncbi:MAG TPA: hypothetical protein VKU19_15775 [Bryobacteraceae bacterium]|nr:hypothetical protein [Bryobacteraceae bacterium]
MRLTIATIGLMLLCGLPGAAQSASPAANPPWKKLEFLLGKWTGIAGAKDTPLGAGQGKFSFELELNRKIIVRHNEAVYDAGERHGDLLIIYVESDKPHAIYFDSEGHVIRYDLSFPEPDRVVFESDGTQPGPRYRLSYWMNGRALDGKFEVAPPGSDYKAYLSWSSKKN